MQALRHICGEIVHSDESGNYHARFDRDGSGPTILSCPECGYPLEEGWFRPTYLVEPMERGMMERTVRSMNCSNCWQHTLVVQTVLWQDPEDEDAKPELLYRVICAYCLEETHGYVSNRYVGRARERDYTTYLTNRQGLSEALGLEMEWRQSLHQNLHDLGYGL